MRIEFIEMISQNCTHTRSGGRWEENIPLAYKSVSAKKDITFTFLLFFNLCALYPYLNSLTHIERCIWQKGHHQHTQTHTPFSLRHNEIKVSEFSTEKQTETEPQTINLCSKIISHYVHKNFNLKMKTSVNVHFTRWEERANKKTG